MRWGGGGSFDPRVHLRVISSVRRRTALVGTDKEYKDRQRERDIKEADTSKRQIESRMRERTYHKINTKRERERERYRKRERETRTRLRQIMQESVGERERERNINKDRESDG